MDADSLVSFGGGSPIDTCKVAIYGSLSKRELVHIAIPTTLSAAEYTHAGGVTDETTRVKGRSLGSAGIAADSDPTILCLRWRRRTGCGWRRGMRALDHAIECAYAIRHQPISDVLANAKSISLMLKHPCRRLIRTEGDERVAHRGHCQFAAWYSIYGAMNTRFRAFAFAGPSDRAEMGCAARGDVVHHAAECHAGYGGHRSTAIRTGGGGVWNCIRSAKSSAGRDGLRRSHRGVHCAVRCSENTQGGWCAKGGTRADCRSDYA